jgi:hypothetical protein
LGDGDLRGHYVLVLFGGLGEIESSLPVCVGVCVFCCVEIMYWLFPVVKRSLSVTATLTSGLGKRKFIRSVCRAANRYGSNVSAQP